MAKTVETKCHFQSSEETGIVEWISIGIISFGMIAVHAVWIQTTIIFYFSKKGKEKITSKKSYSSSKVRPVDDVVERSSFESD